MSLTPSSRGWARTPVQSCLVFAKLAVGFIALVLAGELFLAAACGGLDAAGAAETTPTGKRWVDMNYGPFLTASIEAPRPERNIAQKGLAIRVGGTTMHAAGSEDAATMLFDTDLLRYSVAWSGGFLEMSNIAWDGSHGTHPRLQGDVSFVHRVAPGWARPGTLDDFTDPRTLPYGPLPRSWARFGGLYVHGSKVVVEYTVGDTRVRELPGLEEAWGLRLFTRTINVDRLSAPRVLQVCEREGAAVEFRSHVGLERVGAFGRATDRLVVARDGESVLAVACRGAPQGARWVVTDDAVRLLLPRSGSDGAAEFRLFVWRGAFNDLPKFAAIIHSARAEQGLDLELLTRGGPPRWPEVLETRGKLGPESPAYTVDELTVPAENPWNSWMRLGGFDFFDDGERAAVCTWMGDVWLVSGIGEKLENLRWQRIATGLFQPLGLKIVDSKIYVLGRDQISILHDLNGDGEADFYENFNNDHEVTEHFHEFAMDLQQNVEGDFYYMKGARHGKDSVVPQHGTVLKVSKDGRETRIVANGFRAPNGLCINPDGSLISSDQEGHWTPANRINWIQPGGFYGYMWSYHRGERPTSPAPPLCYIHPKSDRSPAAQLWVTSDRWGPLNGKLISLSYGTGNVYHVLHERVSGQVQGGVVKLPIAMFPTGVMRGRFHADDGQLYVAGLYGWAGNRTVAGGFYRIRYTGNSLCVPLRLEAKRDGVLITFSSPLDTRRSIPASRFAVERWNYKWQEQYGSKDYRLSDGEIGRDSVAVDAVRVSRDGRSVFLAIDDMKPCMQMRIVYRLRAADGARVADEIYHTIHALADGGAHHDLFAAASHDDARTATAETKATHRSAPTKTGQRWLDMNYGPYLTASIESPRPTMNHAQKGLALRVGGDQRTAAGNDAHATLLFDTDLLRFASGWTGDFLEMVSCVYNGQHGTGSHPSVRGECVFVNRPGPGWARPTSAGGGENVFDDPRELPYGPLPRDWARYRGLYLHGDKTVVSYTVGSMDVLEMGEVLEAQTPRAFARHLRVGPAAETHVLQVCEREGAQATILSSSDALLRGDANETSASSRADPRRVVDADAAPATVGIDRWIVLGDLSAAEAASEEPSELQEKLLFHYRCASAVGLKVVNAVRDAFHGEIKGVRRTTTGHGGGENGALWFYEKRSGGNQVIVADGSAFDLGANDFSCTAWVNTSVGGTILAKTGKRWGPGAKSFFIRDGRLVFASGDGGEVTGSRRVDDDHWHHVALTFEATTRRARLFVNGEVDAEGTLDSVGPDTSEQLLRIGFTAGRFPEQTRFIGLVDEVRLYERVLDARLVRKVSLLPTVAPRVVAVAAAADEAVGATWRLEDDAVRLRIPAHDESVPLKILLWRGRLAELERFASHVQQARTVDLEALTRGGPPRWPEKLVTKGKLGPETSAYTADTLTLPEKNPWDAWMRLGGLDFFANGDRAAVCTWSGDVWLVDGVDGDLSELRWQRIATGLFQPLGMKIVRDDIYVLGRDQITILRDLNGDGETDFYETFNNDHEVTEHFHEFAMDLQTDAAGDFYYAKGARHGKRAITRRHGTIIKVSADGQSSEIMAYGFRANNGLCVNPDGSFLTSDQEGTWTPANRINWVRRGGFYGHMWCVHPGVPPTTYDGPLLWLHPDFDGSPAAQVWAESDRWGPLSGKLLSLSYGFGHVHHVMTEEVDGKMQGAAFRLPLPEFPTGVMRGRFHQGSGQLYLCGLFGWGSQRSHPGGFYRVRYTGEPICIPVGFSARQGGVVIRLSEPIDRRRAANPKRFVVERWNYKWTQSYGSKDYKLSDGSIGRDRVPIDAVRVSKDGQTLFLEIADMQPVMQMRVQYRIATESGKPVRHEILSTVHALHSGEDHLQQFETD